MYEDEIQSITDENIEIFKQIASANNQTKYLQKCFPLYKFALQRMEILSHSTESHPLKIKIPLGAKWTEKTIDIKDSAVSRILIIFEFAGILKSVSSIMTGKYGLLVNTYQVVNLNPIKSVIQDNVERIKDYYKNRSPLALIKRDDLPNIWQG